MCGFAVYNVEMVNTDTPFLYTIKKSSRAKSLRITVKRGGEVVVTAPRFFSTERAEGFVAQKMEWIKNKLQYFNTLGPIPAYRLHNNKKDFQRYKKQAFDLACERLTHWNQFYNYKYNKVFIKNSMSRWGSCSKKGNLNFSYKIALLPPELADYVIVHELCHLGQFNHSKAFWELVGRSIPDYQVLRKRLR
jgi:predicted metal-dependent hydrolase